MPSSLFIDRPIRAQLRSLSRAALPRECCAILHGHRDHSDRWRIRSLTPVANHARSRGFFAVSQGDLSIMGDDDVFFHSHAAGNIGLSPLDRRALGRLGGRMIIGSLSGTTLSLRGYDAERGAFTIED